MKIESFNLDIGGLEDDFFQSARLFGIHSDWEAFQLMQILNRRLDYKFTAAPEIKFQMQLNAKEVWGSNKFTDTNIYFNLYANDLSPCATEMYLYENVSDSYHLINSLRFYNILLLIKHSEMLLYEEDILAVLLKISEIHTIKEVDLDELKEKTNLMF